MSRNVVMIALVILLMVLGFWLLARPKQETPTSTESGTPQATEVTITSSGFSPQDITINKGETVIWMNSDTADHTVNSAIHPTHTIYPPLNLDTIKPGEKKSLNFPTSGTYKYHNHLNPSQVGSVTVQ